MYFTIQHSPVICWKYLCNLFKRHISLVSKAPRKGEKMKLLEVIYRSLTIIFYRKKNRKNKSSTKNKNRAF